MSERILMSEAGTAMQESSELDQGVLDARRFNTLVVLIVLGAFGIVLYWIYGVVAKVGKTADKAEGVLGLFALPRRKSRR
jgi:hypothetical protein